MPGGDGIELITALGAEGRTLPRILVLTTYDTERDVRAALEAGADGYLLKDARRAELVRAVTDVAAGRPVLTAEATVKTHRVHAFNKLGVSDGAAAVRVACERGLL